MQYLIFIPTTFLILAVLLALIGVTIRKYKMIIAGIGFILLFMISLVIVNFYLKENNPMYGIKDAKIESLLDYNDNIDSITIYKNHNRYDIDINNICYDNLTQDSMKLAIKLYPKSIYNRKD